MKKNRAFLILFIIIAILFIGLINKRYRKIETVITVSEILISEKWIEDEQMFVNIKFDVNSSQTGQKETVKINSNILFDAIKLNEVYMTGEIVISIPYYKAEDLFVIRDGVINVDKFLQSSGLLMEYGTLVYVWA